MVAHNIYFFNRQGTCLYYFEWHRPKHVREGAGTPADDQKMMFGLFFSLKTFAAAMDPRQCASACCTLHTPYVLNYAISCPRCYVCCGSKHHVITY